MLTNKIPFLQKLTEALKDNNLPVVYIAGKVTGLPAAQVAAKFKTAQNRMETYGFCVLNPVEYIEPDEDWKEAMRKASTMLNMADSIYMLPCWTNSPGAVWEFNQAVKFGLNVMEAPKTELTN